MATLITVELFSAAGCNCCADTKKRLKTMVDELGDDRILYQEVDVLEALDYAVSLRVLTTPAIAIDGELIFSTMPSSKQLSDELLKRLVER